MTRARRSPAASAHPGRHRRLPHWPCRPSRRCPRPRRGALAHRFHPPQPPLATPRLRRWRLCRQETGRRPYPFKDARLARRFRKLLNRIGSAMGESIPLVCQDWANTKAAYRFLSNERVSEEDILGGHFQSTRDRFAAAGGPILILHTRRSSSIRESSLL